MSTFGERLKRLRERKGWTQQELAVRSGIPYETIYRVERGTHQEPRVNIAGKLALALGVSLDVLAGLYDEDGVLRVETTRQAMATIAQQGMTSAEAAERLHQARRFLAGDAAASA